VRYGSNESCARRTADFVDAVPKDDIVSMPGYEIVTWNGIMAPAATPREIVMRLHNDVITALLSPATKSNLEGMGLFIIGGSP